MLKILQKNHGLQPKKWLMMGTMILVMMLFSPQLALAADPPVSSAFEQTSQGLLSLLSSTQEALHSVLWPILLMIGSLLQNDLIYGGGMEPKLLDIWVNIRNIVNVFFVLVLVGIAFYNVVRGGGEGEYQLKTILPKFIIALIAVNFSYLGIKVVLDGVNIVTTGIFALPNSIQTDLSVEQDNGKAFCEGIYGEDEAKYAENISKATEKGGISFCKADRTLDMSNPKVAEFFNTYNSRNAALILALNTQKINLLNKVDTPNPNLKSLTINFLLSTTLYIIYAASYVALLAVLIVRLVVLWLMIVLSPLIALKSVLPQSIMGSLGDADGIGKKFLQHAIVPIPIALVLSIGFILLDTLSKTKFSDSTLSFSTTNVNLLTSGIPTIQDLIAALGSVAFIWKGVFDAASQTYASSITEGIKGFVGGVGKFFGKLPKLIPAFPVAGGRMASIGEVEMAGRSLEHLPDTVNQRNFAKSFPWLAGSNTDGFATEITGKTTPDVLKKLGTVAARSKLELAEDHIQKPLSQHLKKHPTDRLILPGNGKYGTVLAFAEALEKGGMVTAEEMMDFLAKNNIKVDGAKPPDQAAKPGTSPAPGTPAAPPTSGQDIAKKANLIDDEGIKTLQNLDQLKGSSQLQKGDEEKLKELSVLLNAKNPNEKAIQEALSKPETKDLLKRAVDASKAQMTAAADFEQKVLPLRPKEHQELTQQNFEQIEDVMKKEVERVTNHPYKADSKDPKDLQALKDIHDRIASKFSADQLEKMKKATGYQGSATSQIMEPPAIPPKKP